MFRASESKEADFKQNSYSLPTTKNYVISKNDLLEFQVFTNKGEVLIDPTSEFAKQISGTTSNAVSSRIKYLVQGDGRVFLPIIGSVPITGITIPQCDSLLASLYATYYQDVFVLSKISNRRVYILGKGTMGVSGGGGGGTGTSIYELDNENITLIEILAKMGGPGLYSHVDRIKVIRGDLKNPTIFTVDLTRWDSFQKSEMLIIPNDIIYIEAGRRGAIDFLRDFSLISGLLSAIVTLYLINTLK